MLLILFLSLAAVGWFSLNRPLPEYLVAKGEIPAGTQLDLANFDSVALNLGGLENKYLKLADFDPQLQLADTLLGGELVPVSNTALEIPSGQTSIRLTPALEVSKNVVAGSWVSIWRVVEVEDHFQTELVVPRSKVVSVIEPDGLFANSVPQVEILIDLNLSTLVMESITAENDIYLLPLP